MVTRKSYWEVCRAISDMKKIEKNKEDMRSTYHQENLFLKNRWEFSKSVCRGEFGKENLVPNFTQQAANQHYSSYSTPHCTDFNNLGWFPDILTGPEDPNFTPFDISPIRPKDVYSALKNANHKSSPGPDGLPYGILFNLHSPCSNNRF